MIDARAQLETQLNQLHHILNRFEELQQQELAVYQRHQHRYVTYLNRWRAGMYWLWVLLLTVVLSIVAVIVVVGVVSSAAASVSASGEYGNMSSSMGVMLVFLLPFPLALIGAGVIVGVRNGKMPSTNAKREQQNIQIAEQIAADTWPEIEPLLVQLDLSRQEFSNGFAGWFPSKYLTATDVAECWHIVHDHRANTVQGAINVYETILHRQRLENLAAAQLAEQQRATRAAQMGSIITAAGFGASIATQRAEGAATRAALARPVNVNVRVR